MAHTNPDLLDRRQVILLLDDDCNVTEALAFALERDDRALIMCNDVESAQLSLERFHPTVVVADVHVSGEFGFEGLELISFAKRYSPSTRVILMTGDAPEKLQLEASHRGAVAFLQKPFEATALESLIDLMSPAEVGEIRLPGVIRIPLLEAVLSSGRLGTAFQPIFELSDRRRPLGYEALLRYDSDSPLRNPEMLFAYAERKKRVADLEIAALGHALSEAARLDSSALLFFNVHPEVLALGSAFRDILREKAGRAGVALNRVILELTEQGALSEDPRVFRLFDQLRNEGVRLAFDDVGVAYSHLPYIDRIRPEYLKISQNFGTAFESDATRTKLVRNLVALGHDFDCAIILEGIEDAPTAAAAVDLGIRFGQGFLFGRPSGIAAFAENAVA